MPIADKALIEKIVYAHGGKVLWNSVDWIEADISANGFLFKAKHVQPLVHVRMRASAREPHFLFYDYPEPGQTAELIGNQEVRVTGKDGSLLHSRTLPRTAFHGIRRNFWWDDLDFIYFAGYATWNYLTTPFLFMREGFTFENCGQRQTPAGTFLCLDATFPEDLPAHSRRQTFYFDENSLLRRFDYTAEVVGGWAHAAHFCDDYRDFGGLRFPARRRVRPIFFNRVLSGPTLVAIDTHDIRVIRKA
ncbi:MAG: hypothetical protein EPN25_09000 [Nitrospirae bacterium]|nr:MAG: hypothetical protein EPN25_09000 [Nitrospirota bacterium]